MSDVRPASVVALLSVADGLSSFSDKLDAYIKKLPDPFTPQARQLRDLDTHIAIIASGLGEQAQAGMADEVRTALGQLSNQVANANRAIQAIANIKLALSLVGAVFTVATSLATGNVLGSAEAVISLATILSNAISVTGAGGN